MRLKNEWAQVSKKISWSWRPESSFQNTTTVHARGPHAVLKKSNWATGQLLDRGLPEEHPGSRFTAGRKDVKIATAGALK